MKPIKVVMPSIKVAQRDVAEFMREVKGLYLPPVPSLPNQKVTALCMSLIKEEGRELDAAVDGPYIPSVRTDTVTHLVEIADALADLIYVTLYTANTYGIDLEPVWREVQRSNMAKKGGPKRADGKQLKPEGWTPPNLPPIIEHQIKEGNGL